MTAVFNGERTFCRRFSVRSKSVSIGSAASTRRASRIGSPTRSPCCSSMSAGFSFSTRLMRLQGLLPLQSGRHDRRCPNISASIRRSASSPTPTGRTMVARARCPISCRCWASRTQNFVSAATGIVLAVALIRGFARASAKTVGNFWVDLTRCTLYVLLPDLDSLAALFLVWQGVPQTLGAYVDATTLEGAKQTYQPGSCRLADRHQDARHQWRRFLQRQRRACLTRTRRRSPTSSS